MLREIYNKGYFCFEQKFDNWQDSIKASYKPLLEADVVDDTYVQGVIDCVNKYGPYIVLVPNIAMPHSTEGAIGCEDTAISFMRVEEPVDFDPADPDKKAKIFFSLAATDHEKHLKNIQDLMEILMNEEIVEELLNASSKDDLEKIVNKYE